MVISFIFISGCERSQPHDFKNNIATNTKLVALPINLKNQILLPDSALYEGEYLNNLFHGNGTLTWRNGDIYEGDFHKGLMHGKGRIKFVSGDEYEGGFIDGEWNGDGVFRAAAGDEYKGQFKNGMFSGKGRYQATNGDVYDGDFKQDKASGIVRIIYKDTAEYKGEVKDWQMHGKGIYAMNTGEAYSGQFINDVQSGQGAIKYNSGDYYTGEIKGWLGNGDGKLVRANGEIYKGNFLDGMYHGKGKLTYKNGDWYQGEFKKGLRHGQGLHVRAKPNGRKKEEKGWWEYGRYRGEKKPEKVASKKQKKKEKLNAEKIFYSQAVLLNKTLAKLKPSDPTKPDLYMISFASYGQQNVFMKEAQYSKKLFDEKLGTKGYSLMLVNNPKVAETIPLASVTNLERSLQHVAGIMDKKQDILFLFLTSHGSRNHKLSVSLSGLPLNDLPAKKLAKLIKNSGIKWKVIVVSSCYSGGFIKELKDETTLIMTAAKDDHVSFGCSDEAEFTYFGRALFEKAVPNTKSFSEAFIKASEFVARWEKKENYDHSQPQLWTTDDIETQLAVWRKSLGSKTAILN